MTCLFRDIIKNVVFIWRGVRKPSNGVNSIEFSAPKKLKTEYGFGCGQSSSVKHIFNYLRGGDGYHAPPMSIYSEHTPTSVNGVD